LVDRREPPPPGRTSYSPGYHTSSKVGAGQVLNQIKSNNLFPEGK
jgi:hypothetical protein